MSVTSSEPIEAGADAARPRLRELLGATFAYGFTGAASQVVSLLLAPVYTRLLTPAEYGILALLATAASALMVLMNLGFRQAATRFYYDADGQGRAVAVTTSAVSIVGAGAVMLAIVISFAEPLSSLLLGVSGYGGLLALTAVGAYLTSLAQVPAAFLRIEGRARRAMVTNLVVLGVNVIAALSLVLVLHRGIRGAVEAHLLAQAIELLLLLPVMRRYLTFAFDPGHWRKAARYALPFVPHHFNAELMGNLDRIILRAFVDLSDLGLYAIAGRMVSVLALLIGALQQATVPHRLIVFRDPRRLGAYTEICKYAMIAVIAVSFVVSVFAFEALRILTAPPYWGSSPLVAVLALAMVFNGLYVFMGLIGVDWARKSYIFPIVSAAGVVTSVVVNLLLVPSFGAMGAGWAKVATWAVFFGISYWASTHYFPVRYPWRPILMALLLVVMGYLGLTALQIVWPWIALFSKVAVVAGGGLWILGSASVRREFWRRSVASPVP